MEQIYRYSRLWHVGHVLITIAFSLFAFLLIFIINDFFTDMPVITFVLSCLIIVSFSYLLFKRWVFLESKVILDETFFTYKTPFQEDKIHWNEITEVHAGRPKIVLYKASTHWEVHIKAGGRKSKTFDVQPYYYIEGVTFVKTLFSKAKNAKFIKHINNSFIPFLGKVESVEWKENDTLGFLHKGWFYKPKK